MTEEQRDLVALIIKVMGCIARDENDCTYQDLAADLVRAVEAVLDAFATLLPDSDE
jgi:hypothetical protein